MKKQTAVQWLIEQKTKFHAIINNDLEKALAIEKENSEISFFAGYNYEGGYPIDEHEEYYTKTYEK
jgi:hypothetical protein